MRLSIVEARALNLLPILENGLFALGQVLRFPVMALLWVCVAAALFQAGSCGMEWLARRRERNGFRIERWLAGGPLLIGSHGMDAPAHLRRLVSAAEAQLGQDGLSDGALEHLVLEHEEQIRHSLTGPRTLVKVGPSLGLLGTLIPMGTSLASLAAGNLEAMAGQMVVAFTTTIIGLATGTLAYMVAAVRQGWVNQDVRELRFTAERLLKETSHNELVHR
jgi:biopolymer transport protein ExbB/TolQ